MVKRPRVLVIDDDPVFNATVKAILENKDYEVISALSGDEGLEKARTGRPDIILLDIIMPAKDGFSVCEQIKDDPELAEVPVLILTSFARDKSKTNIPVSAGLGLEAEGYIDKPVNAPDLLREVERLLEKAGR
ncbi:MAG: response regulator [Chloroflexi bacterium]|nr:response regulator [Chloroflexota bacterium]